MDILKTKIANLKRLQQEFGPAIDLDKLQTVAASIGKKAKESNRQRKRRPTGNPYQDWYLLNISTHVLR